MHGPASPGWLLVALCGLTGAYCVLRMRSTVAEQRRSAGAEALMGFGMAAMAVPAAVFTPPAWTWPVYAGVFGVVGLRALWAALRDAHHAHHAVGALAMVYMAVSMTVAAAQGAAGQGHAHGGGSAGLPLVTGSFLLYFTGYVLVSGSRLLPVAGVAGGPVGAVGWGDRPELARVCRVSMGIAMVAMLMPM
ncbi:DUF5134 domain-containing protein [Streptomyces sp. NPDC048290]|uniref:DUF5134 domain-containing protein n=1 Tax=Streptomyces sp. NPDC048290 TaxID=3155811 RepID=UPI00341AF142